MPPDVLPDADGGTSPSLPSLLRMAGMSDRCELTELLVDSCACPRHRNSAPLDDPGEVVAVITARFDGRCSVDKAHGLLQGEQIGVLKDGGYACHWCLA